MHIFICIVIAKKIYLQKLKKTPEIDWAVVDVSPLFGMHDNESLEFDPAGFAVLRILSESLLGSTIRQKERYPHDSRSSFAGKQG